MSQSAQMKPTSLPVRSFLNWPVVTDPKQWQGNVAVVGVAQSEVYPGNPVPNDQANAPDAIRLQSGQFCDGATHWDFDIGTTLSSLDLQTVDCGNLTYDGRDYEPFAAWQKSVFETLWKNNMQVFALGGDHGITTPALQALGVLNKDVHVVHIDAHLDWRDDVQGVKGGYSSPLKRASELPWISGMTQIGMRGTGSARQPEVEAARAWGSNIITAAQVHRDGVEAVIQQLPKDQLVYLTIDADGLDPSHMPAVLGPVPGGLYTEQVTALIHAIARNNQLVGMDIVEIAPSIDLPNNITSITAGRLIINAIGATWGPGRDK
ncbi:arginase family protein [Aliamphritea spongicola]|uniref:arginase family protein n=1 Tax=Aliamphritea spongicola TaxID=707589 RepID=UPI00196A6B04|nr:arginase family protein [Aliamphritea spongicola]MBN3560760.1 arginase family protein [Aliamphritea spongicola]